MKPAFAIYGGKNRLVSKIISLIPRHTVYVEPFAGGATLFFKKPLPDVHKANYTEVLNDRNSRITNFYKVLRDKPEELIKACSLTPYSRQEHDDSFNEGFVSDVEHARRWFVSVRQSFAYTAKKGWGSSVLRNHPMAWVSSISNLYQCAERLLTVYVDNDDALNVIKRWDSPQTLFYCDPPYPGTRFDYYGDYTEDNFRELVDVLDKVQGNFMLSCYDYPGRSVPANWERFEFKSTCSASGQGKNKKIRNRRVTQAELGQTDRLEVLWRRFNTVKVREDIQQLYDSGAFNCYDDGDLIG